MDLPSKHSTDLVEPHWLSDKMRSSSVTPPPNDPECVPPTITTDSHDEDIILVSENFRTTRRHKTGPTLPLGASPSANRNRRLVTATDGSVQRTRMEDDNSFELVKKRSKKHERSEELESAAGEGEEKKLASPGHDSPAKKRERREFTLDEDKLIIKHVMNTFDVQSIQKATGRAYSSVSRRFRMLLKTALRGVHGDEHAVLPGEA